MSNISCDCKNNYTEDTFMESFGKDENDMKKCNGCPNMNYDGGLLICEKFGNKKEG